MEDSLGKHYLADSLDSFRAYKKLADKALVQLKDEEFFATVDDEANSIAVLMKHIAGNMLSRWTDFLTTDGEKPNRNRDMEFVLEPDTAKNEMFEYWEKGWGCLFSALENLQPEDVQKSVLIRGQEHTVVQAINRQLTHYAYHIGQIVFLAKHFRSAEWRSLSIPKNRSAQFNTYVSQASGKASKEEQFDKVTEFARAQAEPRNQTKG